MTVVMPVGLPAMRERALDRDRINARAMNDPAFAGMDMKKMPFDAKRMLVGGFQVLVEA